MLLAALAAGTFAWQAQANYANAESQRLAAESGGLLACGESVELAALLALRGLRAQYTPQADLALQRASHASHNNTAASSATFSPDGRLVAVGSMSGAAQTSLAALPDLVESVCARLLRDLTQEERTVYGISDQEPTCPRP